MVFGWFRQRRRRKLLETPMPDEWRDVIADGVWQYDRLDATSREKLEATTRILVAEKNWEGCGGFEMTDEAKLLVAAQAALMTLGFKEERFDRVMSILIYPDDFRVPQEHALGAAGLVVEEEAAADGVARYRGPVVVAWPEVVAGGRESNDGGNVVVHEFAHQLDMLTGEATGTPPMSGADELREWQSTTDAEYKRLVRDCRRRAYPLLDCYGAESPVEFFAVASETFFQEPTYLRREAPDLHRVLSRYYRQEPAWSED